ncbi:MAG: Zn-dependent oxidoreductase, NADPH:quinone reductase [Deltaproteobacteria bacterium]|nr:Zn-dependent oxidoreductase, NADPH:quinone reductase [Deltaproteobacteria bacterium]
MKAYELHPEEGLASLKRVERPMPPALGAHEVRVRVRAVSLNYRDIIVARGSQKRAKRIVPASDGAGEVVAVGDQVTRVKVGDRVAAAFFPTWLGGELAESHHANALGGSLDGMLAEHVVLAETAWVKIPSHFSFEQASTLPCAGVTAWHALFVAANPKPGDTLLVQGTGGVSIYALQLARAAGIDVIATSSAADKRARLERMGAGKTLDYRDDPKWGESARAATAGRGVDVVIEVGGAGNFDQSVKALRYGGTMSLLGVLAGTQGPIDTYAILHKNIRVRGVYVGSVAMFEDLVRALEATKLEPVIDQVFGFGDARAAYEHLASGKHFGKVVIRLDD